MTRKTTNLRKAILAAAISLNVAGSGVVVLSPSFAMAAEQITVGPDGKLVWPQGYESLSSASAAKLVSDFIASTKANGVSIKPAAIAAAATAKNPSAAASIASASTNASPNDAAEIAVSVVAINPEATLDVTKAVSQSAPASAGSVLASVANLVKNYTKSRSTDGGCKLTTTATGGESCYSLTSLAAAVGVDPVTAATGATAPGAVAAPANPASPS